MKTILRIVSCLILIFLSLICLNACSKKTATITWVNYDGTVLETDYNVEYGTTPSYDGIKPVRQATAQYTYTFSGWSPSVSSVTGDKTYTATFTNSVRKYSITWKNYDGSTLKTDSISYGTTPSYNGTTPTKASTAQYAYTFSGWSPSVSSVTGDKTYTATFNIGLFRNAILSIDESIDLDNLFNYCGLRPKSTYKYDIEGNCLQSENNKKIIAIQQGDAVLNVFINEQTNLVLNIEVKTWQKNPSSIEFNKKIKYIERGSSLKLGYSIIPVDANSDLEFFSSDNDVAYFITNDTFYAKTCGSTQISCYSSNFENNEFTLIVYSCNVSAEKYFEYLFSNYSGCWWRIYASGEIDNIYKTIHDNKVTVSGSFRLEWGASDEAISGLSNFSLYQSRKWTFGIGVSINSQSHITIAKEMFSFIISANSQRMSNDGYIGNFAFEYTYTIDPENSDISLVFSTDVILINQ